MEQVGEGTYRIPSDIDVTASGGVSCLAFVISEIFILNEDIDPDVLGQYNVIEQRGTAKTYSEAKSERRSTRYLKKPEAEIGSLFQTCDGNRLKYFVAKLEAPFIIHLNCELG